MKKLQLFVVIFFDFDIIITIVIISYTKEIIVKKIGGSYDKKSCYFSKWWRCFRI